MRARVWVGGRGEGGWGEGGKGGESAERKKTSKTFGIDESAESSPQHEFPIRLSN